MKKEISVQNLNSIVNDVIKRIGMFKIDYSEWKLYYNLLLSTLCLQFPTIRYYDLAKSLTMANVIRKTVDEEEEFNSKRKLLEESIEQAVSWSKQRDKEISCELYNAIALNETNKSVLDVLKKQSENNLNNIDETKAIKKI